MMNVLLVLWTTLIAVNAADWKYGEENQKHWGGDCSNGTHQSPVALKRDVAEEKHFEHLIWKGYDLTSSAAIVNNGHSAKITLDPIQRAKIEGGDLPYTYILDHLHFHWKSEHTVDGYRFPLELHMVHYSESFGNLQNALKHPQGVGVFAVLFDLSPDDLDDFEPLMNVVRGLKEGGTTGRISKFSVEDFLPKDRAGYYRYEGSLTTPNCTEGVLWNIFTDTIPISQTQVKVFELLQSQDKGELKANYRSLQPLNDRKLYLRVSPIRDSAGISKVSVHLIVFCSLFYILK